MTTMVERVRIPIGLALVSLLLLTGIASCSTTPPAPPTQAPTPTPAPAPTPAGPTGTLTVAQSNLGNERWMLQYASGGEMAIVGHVYEFLVYRKPGGAEIIPGVAEKWTMSPDGLTWTFNLRKGVQFHEGYGELTSADVKLSWELLVGEKAISSAAPYFRAAVKSVETPSPYEAVFLMKVPTWDLVYQISTGIANFGIVSKKYIDAVGVDKATANPIGSGPYKFVEHKQGQYIKLEALDKHWRQVPAFRTLIFRSVPEYATRIAMLKTGEADFAEVTPDAKAELEKAGLKMMEIPSSRALVIHFGGLYFPNRPTYDPKIPWVGLDPEKALKVRKAIALAINKQEIIDYVLMGYGKPATSYGYYPDMSQTDPSWKPYPYDPEQAKKLLAEAGYPNGFDLTVLAINIPGKAEQLPTAETMVQQLGKVGIRAKLEKMEFAAVRQLMGERKLGAVLYPIAGSRFDEPAMLLNRVGISKAIQLMGAEDQKLDAMVAKAMSELDFDKRLAVQRELGQYLRDMYYYVPIAVGSSVFGVSKKVGTWPITPMMPYPFYFEYVTAGAK